MVGIKPIVALTFDGRKDKELLMKLNAVAPYMGKKVHTVARMILTEKLDDIIRAQGINIYEYEAQPTVG
jgi:hypothetical protein